MSTSKEELINDGIASILKTPDRNFQTHPLMQDEITATIETLIHEVNRPELSEDLAQYYISIIEFLKTKVLFN
jgi:hypothetical protein